jgi:hypothetical protein
MDRDKQLVQKNDCANPEQNGAKRQIESRTRFASLAPGSSDKHAQLVCLNDAFGPMVNMKRNEGRQLAGVITHCVCFTFRAALFSANLGGWLSMIPALGLASRYGRSRRSPTRSNDFRAKGKSKQVRTAGVLGTAKHFGECLKTENPA